MLFIMQPEKPKRALKTSPFILKLAQILDNPEYHELISWTPCERAFVVHRPYEFSTHLLPKYFRHSNYGSFLRQLNFYSFIKLKNHNEQIHQFQHPLFIRGQPERYRLIKREKAQPEGDRDALAQQKEQQRSQENDKANAQTLEQQISSLKKRQSKLLQDCKQMLQQGNETLEWGFIKSAEVENEQSHNQLIRHKIFDFINHNPHLSEQFEYLDTNIINNILNYLGSHHTRSYPPFLEEIFRMVQNTEMFEMIQTMTSAFSREHKKLKSYTIVNQKERRLPYEGLELDQGAIELASSEVAVKKRKR